MKMARFSPSTGGFIAASALCVGASAAEVVVDQVNVSFIPQEIAVFPGDTVRWVYSSGTHTVTSGSDCTPSGLFDSPLTIKNTEFVWTVPATAAGTVVPYYCDPHCIFGQTGTIRVGVEHVVTQTGLAFLPSSLKVAPGDRIRWVRTAGNHTVTSGADCTADGVHFDGLLSLTSTEFAWIVPQSAAGSTIPYFCAPHCIFGMTGTISVSGQANPADINGDGSVNASDLALLLNAWGTSDAAADVDDNGLVDAADLAAVLGAWTA
ncbi:MAG: Copper binding protein plastocyanin/azurin family [Planctomycetota bacterium]|jgi:plastocyanin